MDRSVSREATLWRRAIESSGDLAYAWDFASDTIEWAGHAAPFFSFEAGRQPTTASELRAMMAVEDRPRVMRTLYAHLRSGEPYDCEYRLKAGEGALVWVQDRGAVQRDEEGVALRLWGTLRRVTQHKEREAQLQYLAHFDDLTGHYNKRRLHESLEEMLEAVARGAANSGALVAFGIDGLDRINRAYGSEIGDCVLKEVGHRLERVLRPGDLLARLGGDRFGLLLSGAAPEAAKALAERVLETVRRNGVETPSGLLSVSMSAGLVSFPAQSASALDALAKAEGALVKAKSAGRDCLVVYELSETELSGVRETILVAEKVKSALRDRRLLLAFQPVVQAVSHEVSYHECLLRMRGPDGSLTPAAAFIPVAEQLGLMRSLDRHVLELAVAELADHPQVTLAMNISGLTASDRSWLDELGALLQGHPELASRLIVEITETAAIRDLEDSARFVASLRDLGCLVAIDDFGGGYTTFRHLKTLAVDVVKIDGAFVRGIAESAENQLFVRNLLSLAQAFKLRTVAECVEDRRAADFLREEGLDLLQGYFFGRPVTAPEWRQPKRLALTDRRP